MSLKTKSEDEAGRRFERQMTLVRASIIDGTFHARFDPDAPPVLKGGKRDIALSEAWRRYLVSVTKPDAGDSTLEQYGYQVQRFVDWVRQNRPRVRTLGAVTKRVARDFASDLAPTVSANTYNKYISLLRLIFKVLLDELDVQGNPWDGIQRRKTNGDGRRAFTPAELAAIFEVIDRRARGEELVKWQGGRDYVRQLPADEVADAPELRTLCLLGFHTALRLADCCLLKWTDVDFARDVIVCAPRKTKRRMPDHRVVIPLAPELKQHLESIRPEEETSYVCPRFAERYSRNGGKGRAEVSDKLMKVFRQAGIQVHKPGTGKGTGRRAVVEVGFHSFRHTWVSMSAKAGCGSAAIRAIASWSSPAMEKTYTHVSEEHLRDAMRLRPSLAEVMGKAPAATDEASVESQLDGMGDDDLRRLMAAIRRRLDGAGEDPETPS